VTDHSGLLWEVGNEEQWASASARVPEQDRALIRFSAAARRNESSR